MNNSERIWKEIHQLQKEVEILRVRREALAKHLDDLAAAAN
jgi:hypothetical protein